MENRTYKAYVAREVGEGRFAGRVEEMHVTDLPAGDVLVRVRYSSLNYKDALSARGNRGVTRRYPHTPGIDAAGTVVESAVDDFTPGDEVVVSGDGFGTNRPGGFGQYVHVPAKWVMKLTAGQTLKESMILGTAGFTAGLCVHEMVRTVKPEHGDILVTGATGGVGCAAVGILATLGYSVVAVSSKNDAATLLEPLGAKDIISRETFVTGRGRALLQMSWAGVVDTVGGDILATAIKSTAPRGVVTCCGNAASPDLPLTVYPFILRGVTLIGIACQHYDLATRQLVLNKLAHEWKLDQLEAVHTEIPLVELDARITQMIEGRHSGRTVVRLDE